MILRDMMKALILLQLMKGMGDCELCGAMNVSTNKVKYHKSNVESCTRCSEKMNLVPVFTPRRRQVTKSVKSRVYSSKNNLNTKSLIENFSKIISKKRISKKWSKKELAEKSNVRLIDIQNIESGKILEDKVVQKIEKTLGINLFTDESSLDYRKVRTNKGGGMTLGDFLDN